MEQQMQIRTRNYTADKRKDILRAAFSLICQKGLKHTSITDITEKAGVSVGTLYKYYPNKKAVFIAAYDMWSGELFKLLHKG